MQDFIGEDDLNTFEVWLQYQGYPATGAPEEMEMRRRLFDESRKRSSASRKVGLMKLPPVPGEYRYAVAIRDGLDLWLTLWVRRSAKGEFFIMMPRGDRDWDVHTSYHLDGTTHMKTHGRKFLPTNRQPLTGPFRGTEHLGGYMGHGPKNVGAICNPADFSAVVEVPSGVLGPRHGVITVDIVQPGCDPADYPWTKIATRQTMKHVAPWVVITVGS